MAQRDRGSLSDACGIERAGLLLHFGLEFADLFAVGPRGGLHLAFWHLAFPMLAIRSLCCRCVGVWCLVVMPGGEPTDLNDRPREVGEVHTFITYSDICNAHTTDSGKDFLASETDSILPNRASVPCKFHLDVQYRAGVLIQPGRPPLPFPSPLRAPTSCQASGNLSCRITSPSW